MFNTASAVAYGGARARYRTVDVSSRLEGASPHRLVAILFEELVRAIETAQAADRRGDRGKRAERQARARFRSSTRWKLASISNGAARSRPAFPPSTARDGG